MTFLNDSTWKVNSNTAILDMSTLFSCYLPSSSYFIKTKRQNRRKPLNKGFLNNE